jgi:glycosyltransferase involved in cell wall biosynthesis
MFLSRLHPGKGADMLLQSWKKLQYKFPDWELVLAGPINDNYSRNITNLAKELNCKRITFTGEVTGQIKTDTFTNSDLFVLPTSSENFCFVIAEAFAHGLPVITTKGAPWQGIEKENCGWWIDKNEDELVACLSHAMTLPSAQLKEMGVRGREWMKRDFTWEVFGKKMYNAYNWLLGKGDKPDYVHVD